MADNPKAEGSLSDRISQPAASSTSPPTATTPASAAPESKEPKSDLADAQVDGAAPPLGGSTLHEPQYDVEVKLSDIQRDANSPLFSISSFEELGM
jgi:ATP-dependent RNA helicase DDX19/DBP5